MSHSAQDLVREDLEVLRECTAHGLPSREETARAVRARVALASREGSIMKLYRFASMRPVAGSAIGIALIAVALLVFPISYVETVGYQATLIVPSVSSTQGQRIAAEFAKLLDTREYTCTLDAANRVTIAARVPLRSHRRAELLAMGYQQTLAVRGIGATSQVVPVTRQISGNVYAAAANQLYRIHVDSDGKTNEQIADELRQRFEAAGLPGAVVRVWGEGSHRGMSMEWKAPPGYVCEGEKSFQITIDGKGATSKPAR